MAPRLRRLHVPRSPLAIALVAGFLASPVGIAHPGAIRHYSCDAVMAGQGPAGLRIGPSAGLDGQEHCFTCRWFRHLRSALASARIAMSDSGGVSPFVPATSCIAAAGEHISDGARAPPA